MLTKKLEFPYESLEAFKELKRGHRGGKNEAQQIGGAAAAAVAGPAAIGAASFTAAKCAANGCAASILSAEAMAAGSGVAAGGLTAGAVASSLVFPIVATVALVGAGVACAVLAVKASKTKDYAQVGDFSSIAHGNIVSLHSECHNRFIRLFRGRVNGRGGRKDIDKMPANWGSEEFLVVQVAESTFSFFSVPHCQYLGMNKKRKMIGIDSKVQEEDTTFDEHEFIVRDEGNGKVSLLSISHDCFVRMDNKGNIDGNAMAAREWELFNVVLLVKNPLRTH